MIKRPSPSHAFKAPLVGALLFLASLAAPAQSSMPNMPPDNSGGKDAHRGISAVIGMGLHFQLPDEPWKANLMCFGVGVLKEVLDYNDGQTGYRHGLFSRRDLLNDALGCGIGWATASGLRFMFTPRGAVLSKEF